MVIAAYLSIITSTFALVWILIVIILELVAQFSPYTLLSTRISKSRQPYPQLNVQGEFRISIFSDLHYGEEEHGWGIDQDQKSTKVIERILHDEDPDIVILSTSHLPHGN